MKEGKGKDQLQLLAASEVITLITCYHIELDGYKIRVGEERGEKSGRG